MDTRFIFTSAIFLLIIILHKNRFKCTALLIKCPIYQMHLQKIIGFRPSNELITESNLLYSPPFSTVSQESPSHISSAPSVRAEATNTVAYNISSTSLVSPVCWRLCHYDENCIAYVHFLESGKCYGFSFFTKLPGYQTIGSDIQLVVDPNAIFYEKTCLKVPDYCKSRLWVLTKIPGNSLVFQGKKTIPMLVTKRECAEKCLFESEFQCLSASFAPSYKNNKVRFGTEQIRAKNIETFGRCILSDKDKVIMPDAFRAAPFHEEYIENQCYDRPIENDSCAYELYSNSTFIYAEDKINGLTQKECQSYCSRETRFYCQGVSFFFDIQDVTKSECLLHSEDIISMGPRSLRKKQMSVYMRRVKCLDVSVICNKDEMAIRYSPKDSFRGKIYVSSHSQECSAIGNGTRSIILRLPIGTETKENRCGILRAYEVTKYYQRIFISALVLIQNNLNVQTQGDRLIKVGCVVKNETSEIGSNGAKADDLPNAIALESLLAFTQNELPNEGSVIHVSDIRSQRQILPKITLQIIDLNRQRETNDVQIGQSLELQIMTDVTSDISQNYDFRATSLVAKSQTPQGYVVLIDENGCPTDIAVFPGLTRVRTGQQNMLRARFHAFKFAGTSLVSFDVKIHFCKRQCQPQNCQPHKDDDSNWLSLLNYNRKRRRRDETFIQMQEDFQVKTPIYLSTVDENDGERNVQEGGDDNKTINKTAAMTANTTAKTFDDFSQQLELPLNYDLKVRGPNIDDTNGFIYGERGVLLIASIDANADNFCINQSLLIALLIFWLVIQICLMFSCCYVIQKYKSLAALENNRRKLHESLEYLEGRRVRWADEDGFKF